ncbi:hypothetical protein Ddye_020642 [Dipteronia dyeriana]|uniref:Ubiquitin-like protease family profile domain-containing protein n=1 Tax=Dipteronia dyeriana TaxID=168575 RepID=A0AAD9U0Q2_9ROSI|nr:hypothetical protein Ddye_020642 [Dipteronia dyeriana]
MKLSEEQKDVVYALGFGNLLALRCGRLRLKICRWLVENFDTTSCSFHIQGRRFVINSSMLDRVLGNFDQGDQISISGDVSNKDFWESKFAITSHGIFLKDIEHSLKEMSTTDDEFKKKLVQLVLLLTMRRDYEVSKEPTLYEDMLHIPPSVGQFHTVAHLPSGHGNQEFGTGNDAHIKERKQYSLKKSLSKLREAYMYDLHTCEKIYIPINDQRGHWYLAVVDLTTRYCQIWDSNPPRRKDEGIRLKQVLKVMQSFDVVLADDMAISFLTSFSFITFSISYAKAPSQPIGFDCELFLYMFMNGSCPTQVQIKSIW